MSADESAAAVAPAAVISLSCWEGGGGGGSFWVTSCLPFFLSFFYANTAPPDLNQLFPLTAATSLQLPPRSCPQCATLLHGHSQMLGPVRRGKLTVASLSFSLSLFCKENKNNGCPRIQSQTFAGIYFVIPFGPKQKKNVVKKIEGLWKATNKDVWLSE